MLLKYFFLWDLVDLYFCSIFDLDLFIIYFYFMIGEGREFGWGLGGMILIEFFGLVFE